MAQDSALKAEESQKAGLRSDLQSPGKEIPVLAQSPPAQLFLLLLFLLINSVFISTLAVSWAGSPDVAAMLQALLSSTL